MKSFKVGDQVTWWNPDEEVLRDNSYATSLQLAWQNRASFVAEHGEGPFTVDALESLGEPNGYYCYYLLRIRTKRGSVAIGSGLFQKVDPPG